MRSHRFTNRPSLFATFLLTVLTLGGVGIAFATTIPQDTATALTGRAIPCTGGRIGDFECHNVELLSYLPADSIGNTSGADLWGWSDSATGREFVIIGGYLKGSTAFVEVTDPVNPKYLGVLAPHDGITPRGAQGVKVYRHYALVTFESTDYGLQIFDLTQLRAVGNAPVVFQETAHYDRFTNAHTIAVNPNTGFAYANGTNTCGGGLHMVDLQTPTKPAFAGCYSEVRTSPGTGLAPGYVHDTQCVTYRGPDVEYRGREICINSSGDAISIADVADKQQPKTISIVSYPNVGFAHQGWFDENQRYFFVNDEEDEVAVARRLGRDSARTRTIIFDLTDLDDPVVAAEYYATTRAVDHNLYVRGQFMYQGNTTAGLRIIDVTDPSRLAEAGYLTGIGWAWGTYPYLNDDVVAVSTTSGLVLVRLLTR